MPGRGLEPLRISPPDPKSGASANFATLAIRFRSVNSQLAIANDGGSRRGLIIADEAPDGAGLAQVEDVAGLAGFAATGQEPSFSQQLQLQPSVLHRLQPHRLARCDDNSRWTSPDHPCASTAHRNVRDG